MLDDFSIGCTVQNVVHMIAMRIKVHPFHYFRQIKPHATSLDHRCVIFVRIKFIELRSSDTTTVTVALPLICPWTVASSSHRVKKGVSVFLKGSGKSNLNVSGTFPQGGYDVKREREK